MASPKKLEALEVLRCGGHLAYRSCRPKAAYTLGVWIVTAVLLAGKYGTPGWFLSREGILCSLLASSVFLLGDILQSRALSSP